MPRALFSSGEIAITPGADALLADLNLHWIGLIARHLAGDWGDLCNEDKKENDLAITNGSRILSAYAFGQDQDKSNQHRLWVLTEADRSATTILLPSEY